MSLFGSDNNRERHFVLALMTGLAMGQIVVFSIIPKLIILNGSVSPGEWRMPVILRDISFVFWGAIIVILYLSRRINTRTRRIVGLLFFVVLLGRELSFLLIGIRYGMMYKMEMGDLLLKMLPGVATVLIALLGICLVVSEKPETGP
jgi:hypothetical protein